MSWLYGFCLNAVTVTPKRSKAAVCVLRVRVMLWKKAALLTLGSGAVMAVRGSDCGDCFDCVSRYQSAVAVG
jgi:hypothetical protein